MHQELLKNISPYLTKTGKWLGKIAKSKTMWFASALTVLGILEQMLPIIQTYYGDYFGISYIIIGVLTAIFRAATTDAISDK